MTQDERIERARCTEPDPVVAASGHLMSLDGRPSEVYGIPYIPPVPRRRAR
jgi:hypothetical protein